MNTPPRRPVAERPSRLQEEIDLFAGRIKLASQSAKELDNFSMKIRDRFLIIQQVTRDAQVFRFVSDEIKSECLRLDKTLDDAARLLNSLEAGSRGLRAVAVMDKLWRELP